MFAASFQELLISICMFAASFSEIVDFEFGRNRCWCLPQICKKFYELEFNVLLARMRIGNACAWHGIGKYFFLESDSESSG